MHQSIPGVLIPPSPSGRTPVISIFFNINRPIPHGSVKKDTDFFAGGLTLILIKGNLSNDCGSGNENAAKQ